MAQFAQTKMSEGFQMVWNKTTQAWDIVERNEHYQKGKEITKQTWRLVKDKTTQTWNIVKPVAIPAAQNAAESLLVIAENGYRIVRVGQKKTWALLKPKVVPPVQKQWLKIKPHVDKFLEAAKPVTDVLGNAWDFTWTSANKATQAIHEHMSQYGFYRDVQDNVQ